jgi:hypothetical protein
VEHVGQAYPLPRPQLALKLHPDKNRALRADEAFKVGEHGMPTVAPGALATCRPRGRARVHWPFSAERPRDTAAPATAHIPQRMGMLRCSLHTLLSSQPPDYFSTMQAVGRAFATLSDSQKRAYYDRTGHESSAAAAAAQRTRSAPVPGYTYYGPGGADEFDPEEIFNM